MIKKETFTLPGAKGRGISADLTFDDANKAAPLVIFVHGFKGFKDWGTHNLLAHAFVKNGFRLLKFNFSHNGTTPDHPADFVDLIAFGDNTFSFELDDLKTVIDFACNGSLLPRAAGVYLIGHSMGGGISVITAAEDKRVKKLITLGGLASFRNLWSPLAEAQWRLQGTMYVYNSRTKQQMPLKSTLLDDLDRHVARLDILDRAAEVTCPWLIMHGDADTTVNVSHAKELKKAQPNAELVIVEGGDHTFGGTHPYTQATLPRDLNIFADEAVAFFKEQNI